MRNQVPIRHFLHSVKTIMSDNKVRGLWSLQSTNEKKENKNEIENGFNENNEF